MRWETRQHPRRVLCFRVGWAGAVVSRKPLRLLFSETLHPEFRVAELHLTLVLVLSSTQEVATGEARHRAALAWGRLILPQGTSRDMV